jgi:phosphatidylglycerol:prolipoprotein diacylglycerol transferase
MWPTLLRVPWTDVEVPTWGALLVVALAVGIAVAARLAARDGVEPAATVRAGLAAVAASLVGVNVMGSLDGSRGRVLYGGIVAGVAATLLSARAFGIRPRALVDAGAVGLAFGIAIGRLGCFAGGCCAGTVCAMPWGVAYPTAMADAHGFSYLLPVHPVQLYEAALAAAIGAYLVRLHRRRTFGGQAALAFLVLYPAARFAVEFWRGDDRGDLLGLSHATGLSPAQLVSIAVAALALGAWASGIMGRGSGIRAPAGAEGSH